MSVFPSDSAMDDVSDLKSETSDFVDDYDDGDNAESSEGESSPLDSDASQDSSGEEHSDIDPPIRSSRPAKKARTSTASSLHTKISRQACEYINTYV
jgi:hypothetical protein